MAPVCLCALLLLWHTAGCHVLYLPSIWGANECMGLSSQQAWGQWSWGALSHGWVGPFRASSWPCGEASCSNGGGLVSPDSRPSWRHPKTCSYDRGWRMCVRVCVGGFILNCSIRFNHPKLGDVPAQLSIFTMRAIEMYLKWKIWQSTRTKSGKQYLKCQATYLFQAYGYNYRWQVSMATQLWLQLKMLQNKAAIHRIQHLLCSDLASLLHSLQTYDFTNAVWEQHHPCGRHTTQIKATNETFIYTLDTSQQMDLNLNASCGCCVDFCWKIPGTPDFSTWSHWRDSLLMLAQRLRVR